MDFGTQTHGDTTPHTRDVLITNDGNKKLDWTVTVTSGSNWLSFNPASDQIAAHSQETTTASAQTGSLATGDYTAQMVFNLVEGSSQLNKYLTATVTIQ